MIRLRSLRGQHGFTFIESLLSMAIGGIIITAVIAALFQINVLTRTQQDTLTAQTQIQNALATLNYDLVSTTEGVVTLDGGGSHLILTRHQFAFGEATPEPTSTVVTYTFAGGNLTRAEDGQQIVVARNLQAVALPPAGTLPKKVEITLMAEVRDRSYTQTLVVDRRSAS